MAKAERLVSLRAEIAALEADIRSVALTLGHRAWQTTGDEQKDLLEQSGILSRALQGRL